MRLIRKNIIHKFRSYNLDPSSFFFNRTERFVGCSNNLLFHSSTISLNNNTIRHHDRGPSRVNEKQSGSSTSRVLYDYFQWYFRIPLSVQNIILSSFCWKILGTINTSYAFDYHLVNLGKIKNGLSTKQMWKRKHTHWSQNMLWLSKIL